MGAGGLSPALLLTRLHFDLDELDKDTVYTLVDTLLPVEFIYQPLFGLRRVAFSVLYERGDSYRWKLGIIKRALDKCSRSYRIVRVVVARLRETGNKPEDDVKKAVEEVFGTNPPIFLGSYAKLYSLGEKVKRL